MNHSSGEITVPPFPPEYRASGLLLHVTSLPSPYGIGDLGPSAYSWVNLLHDAGQAWWQSLPMGPTGYGNSPYQPMSSFAGNALLISPESLISDGLLTEKDCESHFPSDFVDYDAVIPFKVHLLQLVWEHFKSANRTDLQAEFDEFQNKQEHWLDDYALFRALKAKYDGAYYLDWPEEVVQRRPEALASARRELADEIEQVCFAQFLLFRQGDRLKAYAHSKGVRRIGDLPFFVSPDSSDVWAHPELFLLDEHHRPRFVAGVPPDYFSAQGQLWGNPVYNWDAQRATGYRWAIDRIRALLDHVDAIRLDQLPRIFGRLARSRGGVNSSDGPVGTGPARTFFRLCLGSWAACPSSSKISESLLRMFGHCVTNFNFREHGFCSLLSTVIPTIHTCLTTSSATLSSTPAPMTTRQLGSGMKNCLTISARTSGTTSSEHPAEALTRRLH